MSPPRMACVVGAVVIAVLATPLTTGGQQPDRIVRIGFLGTTSAESNTSRVAAFRQGLRELGYADSRVLIEARHAAGKLDPLPILAAELVRLKVDVLVSESTPATVAATQNTPMYDLRGNHVERPSSAARMRDR